MWDESHFICLQANLDHLYLKKAQGARVRWYAKWTEEEEKIVLFQWIIEKGERERQSSY